MAQCAYFFFTDFIISIEIGFATLKLAGHRFAGWLEWVSFYHGIPDPQNHGNVLLGKAPADGISDTPVAPGHQCHAFIVNGHAKFLRLSAILYKNRRLRSQIG
jgi:hypothetical protein